MAVGGVTRWRNGLSAFRNDWPEIAVVELKVEEEAFFQQWDTIEISTGCYYKLDTVY